MTAEPFEHYIKYMGSKTKLIDRVVEKVAAVEKGAGVCDLFAGSCSLSGALAGQVRMFSNDIQAYSGVLAETYLNCYRDGDVSAEGILDEARAHVEVLRKESGSGEVDYEDPSLDDFVESEERSRLLVGQTFGADYHLFTKNYSGTWWSVEQCLWIDALRQVYEVRKGEPCASLILSSLMYAMAYCSQGTGHFAQYRDAKNASSLKDILIYRRRSLPEYFARKFDAVFGGLPSEAPVYQHEITRLDFAERLGSLPECTVYADPPYCFVHYSRFYHALETVVLYDYPELQQKSGATVKGRYREGRHQSPFSIRSQVAGAFEALFEGVRKSGSSLVLSYSNTGMIELEELLKIAGGTLAGYRIDYEEIDYDHKTMGRKGDSSREVKECLISASC
ncbi:MAG: DNA adenine methylase [Verrucomicrobiaceae bacterium]